jgi:hypothetical protein
MAERDDGSSEMSSQNSGSDGADGDCEVAPKEFAPIPAPARGGAVASLGEATDENVELWLMRVPKHSVLRAELVGKEISLDLLKAKDGKNGVVRGNYYFSDCDLRGSAKVLRPVLTTDGPEGPVFKIGPAFARQVDVTFRPAFEPAAWQAPSRDYPRQPQNLSVKYKPIGPHSCTLFATGVYGEVGYVFQQVYRF